MEYIVICNRLSPPQSEHNEQHVNCCFFLHWVFTCLLTNIVNLANGMIITSNRMYGARVEQRDACATL